MRGVRDILLTSIAPLTWGTTYIVTTQFLPQGRPLLVGAIRALPIGLLLLLYVRRLPAGIWWWRAFVLGLLNITIVFAFLFESAYRLPGGAASTLGAVQPLIVAFLGWPLLRERPSLAVIVCSLVSIAGVAMLVLGPEAGIDGIGVAAALAFTLAMALGTIMTKRWGVHGSVLAFTAWQLVAGGLVLLPLSFLMEGPWPAFTPVNIGGFVYLTLINTGLAYVVWFRGIARMGASAITFLMLLVPLVATALGYFFLDQTLDAIQMLGGLLVIGGIVTSQSLEVKRAQAAPAGGVRAAVARSSGEEAAPAAD